jgi:WD40 repeat protein
MKTFFLILISFILITFNLNAQEPQKIWTGNHSSTVTSVDFLPDGRVISGSYDGKVKLWTTNGIETIIYASPLVAGRFVPVESVATDGNIIVAGLENGLVQVLGGNNWNIGARVLSVSVNNGNVAASGVTPIVYINGDPEYSSDGVRNDCVVIKNEGVIWGSSDRYVRTSWGYAYQDADWILGVDYHQLRTVSVGVSEFVKMNGVVIAVLPQKGANSIHINRVNGKLLVSDWSLNIFVIRSAGGFLDAVAEKNFKEVALVRSIKWNPANANQFAYGTADGRVVLANNEYLSNSSSTNTPIVSKKGKGRR